MTRQRIQIDPGDVPAAYAARRLGISESAFRFALPDLQARGFPEADPTTGNFDLQAIDEWRRQRHASLFGLLGAVPASRIRERLRQAYPGG